MVWFHIDATAAAAASVTNNEQAETKTNWIDCNSMLKYILKEQIEPSEI